VYVDGGQFVGGSDVLIEMYPEGELEMVEVALAWRSYFLKKIPSDYGFN